MLTHIQNGLKKLIGVKFVLALMKVSDIFLIISIKKVCYQFGSCPKEAKPPTDCR